MFLIYTIKSTKRLKYVFELVFEHILGLSVAYTQDKSFFLTTDVCKLNYSSTKFEDIPYFKNVDLLFSSQIVNQNLVIDICRDKPAFFFHKDEQSFLPFDPFALIFYLVSRYEEYIANEFDQHNRFTAHQSLAFQYAFLHRPLVNEWILEIKKILREHYPNLTFKEQSFQFTPTYDIDYAWSYKHKGILRTIGGSARDFIKNRELFYQRIQVLRGKKEDPYFAFDCLNELHRKLDLEPIYFFLVGERGQYDKNVSIRKKAFQALIYKIGQQNAIGLHPSYASNSSFQLLEKEYNNLHKISSQNIYRSRQHFLKLSFPTTYRNLIRLGIKEDYSMGYAAQVGFRASIASSFHWFDLEKNEKTDLQIFPFQIMDVTLKNYLKLSKEEAIETATTIIENTKAVNGHLMTLFHNNSFCEQEGWQGWRAVYERILRNV